MKKTNDKKKYKVKLKNGLLIEMNAKNEKDLHKKIASGFYSALGMRANDATQVTRENVVAIQEVRNK